MIVRRTHRRDRIYFQALHHVLPGAFLPDDDGLFTSHTGIIRRQNIHLSQLVSQVRGCHLILGLSRRPAVVLACEYTPASAIYVPFSLAPL